MKSREEIKTTFLLNELKESKSIYEYLKANQAVFSETVFSDYLQHLIRKNKIPKTEVIMQSGLSKSYTYALLNGERKPPHRDRVIALAFAVKADLDEIQNLLIYSDFKPLSPKVERDAAIIFAVEQRLSCIQLIDLLFDLNLDPLD